MCSNGLLLFAVLFFSGLLTIDCFKEGCPGVVQRSSHFAKVHNGTCYLFVDRERYWEDARDSCQRMGGEMLSVEDYGTMRFVRSVLGSLELGWNKRGVWLGARFSSGAWRWTSGKKVGYANWASGEPSKLLGIFSVEDCALMRSRDNWRWHDYICGRMKYHFNYICQFPVQNPTTTTTTTTTSATTPVATVLKPGHTSKKGHFTDGKDSHLDDYESFQRDMGHESGVLDHAQNGVSRRPYGEQGGVQDDPYDSRHPASNDRGYNEVHSTSQVLNNGNLTILTIILVTGGIVLLILLLIFLIIRKRYNYKKAMGQPATVHFENRNYNHAHNSGSGHHSATTPLPPPPAPHTFHRVPVPLVPPYPLVPPHPLVPPRPLMTPLPPRPAEAVPSAPHLSSAYVPHSCPASDLYLTPMEIGGGGIVPGADVYEEIPASAFPHASNLTYTPARSHNMVTGASGGGGGGGGGGRRCLLQHEDSATIPLISASGCPWNQSDDSLNDTMSTSLTMKTSSIHNDYVDMNGSPVVPTRNCRHEEAGTSKAGEGKVPGPDGNVSSTFESDPKSEMSVDDGANRPAMLPGECKQPVHSDYSNLMTTSQERCENLYAKLH